MNAGPFFLWAWSLRENGSGNPDTDKALLMILDSPRKNALSAGLQR